MYDGTSKVWPLIGNQVNSPRSSSTSKRKEMNVCAKTFVGAIFFGHRLYMLRLCYSVLCNIGKIIKAMRQFKAINYYLPQLYLTDRLPAEELMVKCSV